ncbi:MAG: capsule assembly Wzi family protein [Anditalea sp.]
MKLLFGIFLVLIIGGYPFTEMWAQNINAGSPVFEEALRRKQLLGELDSSISFHIRPLKSHFLTDKKVYEDLSFFMPGENEGAIHRQKQGKYYTILPIRNTQAINIRRPYGWGNSLMIPNVGAQNYTTGGISYHHGFFQIQFQPELMWAQNKSFAGYPNDLENAVNRARFVYWNYGDYPERFGDGFYARLGLGQTKVSVNTGAFELGISTENIWWGPGQFNALIFSNNAQGFPHISLNTTRPAKTFLGSFEGQLIMGRLKDSQMDPSQHPELNELYFREFSGDWRYLNGISVSYQPKWVPGLFLGATRTFQNYNQRRGKSFRDWLPIFNGVTKVSAGLDLVGESDHGRDQQISVFSRYLFTKGKAEIYFEYGRRDHAYNWREFVLNPEHARAYLMGFSKLIPLPKHDTYIQVRGEMTQQQESVNRMIRYRSGSGITWHTHNNARGFAHKGEALGVGVGAGSNVQSVEVAYINGLNKLGILLERVANHQDFYYKAFGDKAERKPWVDLSLGFLLDYQWERFMFSSKLQLISGKNYQWQLDPSSSPELPIGKDRFGIFSQNHLMYLF